MIGYCNRGRARKYYHKVGRELRAGWWISKCPSVAYITVRFGDDAEAMLRAEAPTLAPCPQCFKERVSNA